MRELIMRVEPFTILIADRNPHVRDFLRRELMSAGYRVKLARNEGEVLRVIDLDEAPDILVLDLNMPGGSRLTTLEQVQKRKPHLPVIVHTVLTEYAQHPTVKKAAMFWEKRGNDIDGFKAMVAEVLQKAYPYRSSELCRTNGLLDIQDSRL
jgi:DNA-binding NtrC family response regulator